MPKPILDGPRIVAFIGQRVTTGVPKHVGMDFEREAGALTDALDQAIDRIGGERAATLGLEHVGTAALGSIQLAQRAEFIAPDRVRSRFAVLGAADMKAGIATELDLRPFEIADLDGPEPMAISHQDHGRVAMAVPTPLSFFDQLIDLGRSQVLARPEIGIAECRRGHSCNKAVAHIVTPHWDEHGALTLGTAFHCVFPLSISSYSGHKGCEPAGLISMP